MLYLDKITKFIKKYKDYLLGGIILVLLLVIFFSKEKDSILVEEVQVLKDVEVIRDINNKLYAKIEQQAVDLSTAKKVSDSLAKVLQIKPKFIKGETKYITRTDTAFFDKPTYILIRQDTAYMVEKKDAWVDIEAVAGKDTGWIKFSHRDTITHIEVVKTHLFKPTERNILINHSSPYTITEKAYSWTVKEKKPSLVLGLGGSFIPVKPYIIPSFSIVKPIFTIYKR